MSSTPKSKKQSTPTRKSPAHSLYAKPSPEAQLIQHTDAWPQSIKLTQSQLKRDYHKGYIFHGTSSDNLKFFFNQGRISGKKFYLTSNIDEVIKYAQKKSYSGKGVDPVILVFKQTDDMKKYFALIDKFNRLKTDSQKIRLVQGCSDSLKKYLMKSSACVSDTNHYVIYPDDDKQWIHLSRNITAIITLKSHSVSPPKSSSKCTMS